MDVLDDLLEQGEKDEGNACHSENEEQEQDVNITEDVYPTFLANSMEFPSTDDDDDSYCLKSKDIKEDHKKIGEREDIEELESDY